jgi:tetratricopeptide (TPR) repeat protein
MGQYEHRVMGNDTQAIIHYRKAWQYGRNDTQMLARFSGIALQSQNLEEALYLQRQAVALDPLSYFSRGNLAIMLYWSGHFDEARAEFLHAKVLNPARAAQINKDLALVLIQQNKYMEAEQLLVDANSSSQRDKVLAMAYHARGEPSKSQAAANRLSATSGVDPAVYLAEVYAFIGDLDRSLDWLAVASQRYFSQEYYLQDWRTLQGAFFSPCFKPLMGDPRLLAWRSDTLVQLRTARTNSAQLYTDAGLKGT